MRPQQPSKSASASIIRIMNKRLEIKQAGNDFPHVQAKAVVLEGLRKDYQSYYVSFLRGSEFETLDTLQSKLTQNCNSVERQIKMEAKSDSICAHFGELGRYQLRSPSTRPMVPTPVQSHDFKGVLDGIRSFLLFDSSFGYEARQEIESAFNFDGSNH